MPHFFIMGAGGFGVALAVMASRACAANVTLWSPFEDEVLALHQNHCQERLLPGIQISRSINITTDITAVSGTDLVMIATPSFAVRETARRLANLLPEGIPVACVSKGIEAGSFKTLSAVISEELPRHDCVALSGPSHAEEVARGVPTAMVAASRGMQAAGRVQELLMNESLRVYLNVDVTGVELGGALKNVIALAAGVLDGLGIGGDNTKAALMTRGVTEIARLGVALGARAETFAGLSGIGDLIVTCESAHSRNRRFGTLIGQGRTPEQALELVGMTVEGYPCTKTAHSLSHRMRVEAPIIEAAYRVLYEGMPPLEAIRSLMQRPKRHESEEIWVAGQGPASYTV